MNINERIAALSPEQRALFELRLKQKNLQIQKTTSIPKRTASDILSLSLNQERLWLLHQLQPDTPLYNESSLLRFTGVINTIFLEKSINEIIKRHEILRTSFQIIDEQTLQVIAPSLTFALTTINLQTCPEAETEAKVKQIVTENSRQPFDLSQAPLFRGTLIHLSEQEHILLLTMHHIISDGWSWQIFYRELAALYQGFCKDSPVTLPELPIQYADFALWQRQCLNDQERPHQLTYWKQQLQDAPPILNLPTDYPRPAQQSFQGARATIIIPQAIANALKSLSQQENVTPFMVILAAFKTLLYRYTGQTDLLVGTPVANRTQIETENLLGCFVNSLVLRTDLSNEPSFRELLARVRQTALAAYAHQDLPFEQLVKELQPKRTLSHTPLFQVMCVFQDAPLLALELPNLTLTPLIIDSGTAKFDLTLYLEDTKQELIGFLEYNSDLFHTDTINRMVGHFQTLLIGIVANPDQCIAKLPLLTHEEQNQLLANNLPIKIDYSPQLTLHQLFEQQVEKTPDAVAVVLEQQLTYAELNAKANQIAHYLQQLGIKTEELVGICLPRSLEMVIGILGILKAGAAYVPLDPNYPAERLAFVLEDAQLQVILTQQQLSQKLSTDKTKLVCLDTDREIIAGQSTDNPNSQATSASLAYIIYTSGSTGKPKGVLVNHSNVMRLFAATDAWFKFNHEDVWTLFHSIAFDFSVWEIWGALLYGGRLVVVPYEITRSPQAFYQLLLQQQVTVLNQTPSAFRQLIKVDDTQTSQQLTHLRYVIFGGEALEIQSLQPHFERYGDKSPQLINMYGITETTVHVTYHPLTVADLTQAQASVIGCPIPDLEVYVLDQHQQLLPIGVAGEMYVGGAGLARGYLNRPELTAQRFISHPLAPETRLYRSGDLARYLPNGELEYLGRIDNQVKIRGFRIELGEIETTLCQHPKVRETVVLPWEDAPNNKRLVAYIVPLEPAPTTRELQNWLKDKLPEYMIPAAFVLLPALPLTANGKVARRALPAPNTTRPELDKAFVAPRTTTEQVLADIWAQVLGLEEVGINDNFFELGGDSILSTQIIAKANQAGLQLTFRQLFTHQTIAELAAVTGITPTTLAEQGAIVGQVPLTPIQHWFFEQNLPAPHHWNQAVLLELRQIDPELIQKAWQHLLIHHDALRLRFVAEESNWQQQIAPPDGEIPFSQVVSTLSATEQTQAITEQQASLNFSTGLLVRIALFNLGDKQPSRLLIVMHHLVVDGVSWRILLEDLQTAYQQLSRGENVNLPPKTTSYKQWAEKLKEYAQSNVLQKELEYWLAIGKKQVAQLPVDYLQGANTEATSCNVSVALSQEETRVLLQEVPKVYNTRINDVLLTALIKTFSRWTGKSELLIDLEGHGREDIFEGVNLSRTVGWFTSIFPVLLSLSADVSLGEVLKSIKEQLRTIPKQGIGYGVLRYLSDRQEIIEQMRELPQAEISFNYFGQFDQVLPEKPGVTPLLRLTQDFPGVSRSPQALRRHLLDINGFVADGQLRLEWTYSQNIYKRMTVENLAQSYLEQVRSLISYCQSVNTRNFTPSDFPKAKLSQKALDQFLNSITKASGEGEK